MQDLEKVEVRRQSIALMTLIDAANVIQRGLEKRLVGLGLSVAQQRILALAYLASESLTPSMLAALLLQETHSVSGLLNRLEERGLIRRVPDEEDRRGVWVELTDEGRDLAMKSIDLVLGISRELDPLLGSDSDVVRVIRGVRDTGMTIAGVHQDARREGLRRVWG